MDNIIHLPSEDNPRVETSPEIGDVAEIPVGFDPDRFPIIARHWYGVSPAAVCVETVAQAV